VGGGALRARRSAPLPRACWAAGACPFSSTVPNCATREQLQLRLNGIA
jgi:hypothetical protein